nr:two-component response regulator-like PRR73 [Ipomoea batatas]
MDNWTQHRRVRDAAVAEELLDPGKAEAQQEMHEMISAVVYDPLENLTNDPTNVTDLTPQTANPRKVVVSYSFPEREKFAEMQRSLSLAVEEGGDDREIDWKLELNKTQKNELKDMDNGHVAAITIKHNLLLEITAKDVPTDPS